MHTYILNPWSDEFNFDEVDTLLILLVDGEACVVEDEDSGGSDLEWRGGNLTELILAASLCP